MARVARSDLLVWVFTAVLAATGGIVWWQAGDLPQLTPGLAWPVVAALYAVSERFVVHLPFGREVHSLTFSQIPLVAGLFFLSADELMLAAALGILIGNALVVRRPPIKAIYNVASTIAETALEIAVFLAALEVLGADVQALDPRTWLATLVAVLVGDLFSSLSLLCVIGIRLGRFDLTSLRPTLVSAVMGTVIVTDLALVTILVARTRPSALTLLTLGLALTYLLYRGYHVQRLRSGRLDLLYRFTRSVEQALPEGTVEEAVRRRARELLRAQHAEVAWLHGEKPDPALWWHPAYSGELVRLPRGGTGPTHQALTEAGHVDGMAAPLRDRDEVVGVLLVADRLDDVSTFDEDDGRLLEALAGHASVALANAGLIDRVRAAAAATQHLSLHDPLTGLPNRLSFQQQLDGLLSRTGRAAVVLMDVDRFKEVNDTLGHEAGDELLVEVSQRLRDLQDSETVVARLGGDEFAILLAGDAVRSEGMVARVQRTIARPLQLADITVNLTASIGIASAPADGSTSALLLRRAEVAMYDAKGSRSGVERYSPDRDPNSSRRLSLVGDLGRALENGTLHVHYQPQADPVTGRVTGAEALLRWKHPVWGDVPPDEFVALAEHTGLIRALTRYVLRTAIAQCVAWRDAGTPVLMAVNISARNLLEPELPADAARLLLQSALPASLLKLEVTESAIVAESERATQTLQSLVDLGLSLSIDDFGTGYSSLTRLRNLPVQEVKIDRTFVRRLADDGNDQAIVRAVIGLGHSLGLRVVAEGVEDEAAWRLLRELDCDLVQGYYLARPMSGEAMSGWLRDQFAAFATRLPTTREDASPRRVDDGRSRPGEHRAGDPRQRGLP